MSLSGWLWSGWLWSWWLVVLMVILPPRSNMYSLSSITSCRWSLVEVGKIPSRTAVSVGIRKADEVPPDEGSQWFTPPVPLSENWYFFWWWRRSHPYMRKGLRTCRSCSWKSFGVSFRTHPMGCCRLKALSSLVVQDPSSPIGWKKPGVSVLSVFLYVFFGSVRLSFVGKCKDSGSKFFISMHLFYRKTPVIQQLYEKHLFSTHTKWVEIYHW